MTRPLKIGIAGARGIGKHHAKWFAKAACDVTAIYGRTEESALAAAAGLRDLFGFTGRAFHDWDRFRAEGGFEACSVCSPAEAHLENVQDLAADGRHLLCEKPLVWNWDRSPRQLVEAAAALVEAAERHGVTLAVNVQYPAVLAGWEELHRQVLGRDPVYRSLHFTMETKGKPRSPHGAAEVWVDLAPHPLAVLDALAPGEVDWSTLRHEDGPHEAIVDFDWLSGDLRLPVHIECRRTTDGTVCRKLGNQDLTVVYDGCHVDGEFRARLRAQLPGAEHEWVGTDLMQVSVERFVEAVRTGDPSRVLVDGPAGIRQQMALTGIWAHCWE
ncbi:MAG: oxidoreductase domain protein [Armatimonadetes bacterium]|jgi:predicted dehydrogenase|nr:oxidoreductase domain protein [Armatimonadota bacterium]